jgi:hypothetical protein
LASVFCDIILFVVLGLLLALKKSWKCQPAKTKKAEDYTCEERKIGSDSRGDIGIIIWIFTPSKSPIIA